MVEVIRSSLTALKEEAVATAREEWGAGLAESDAFAPASSSTDLEMAPSSAAAAPSVGNATNNSRKSTDQGVVVSEGAAV